MRHYTDIDDFANGVKKLKDMHKRYPMMPVLLQVDGIIAPFGICMEQNVNGVKCLVFTGYSSCMDNVSVAKRKEQIRTN